MVLIGMIVNSFLWHYSYWHKIFHALLEIILFHLSYRHIKVAWIPEDRWNLAMARPNHRTRLNSLQYNCIRHTIWWRRQLQCRSHAWSRYTAKGSTNCTVYSWRGQFYPITNRKIRLQSQWTVRCVFGFLLRGHIWQTWGSNRFVLLW